MLTEKQSTIRVRILVKAYPQPSKTYEETVCVAAVTDDGKRLVRLYPIRYRKLPKASQFGRFDLVECRVTRPTQDHRPESFHVDEDSIRVLSPGGDLKDAARVNLWRNHVVESLARLQEQNVSSQRSLGIIRPDPGSLRFFQRNVSDASTQEREINEVMCFQSSLFEEPLQPLQKSGLMFGYHFRSGGYEHTHIIHDWEVQAAFIRFRAMYGSDAMAKLKQAYAVDIPMHNVHFILGTMKAHPRTFIIIGLLRSKLDPDVLGRQAQLPF